MECSWRVVVGRWIWSGDLRSEYQSLGLARKVWDLYKLWISPIREGVELKQAVNINIKIAVIG